MENVNIKINGQDITVPADYTVLQAARTAGIDIPLSLLHISTDLIAVQRVQYLSLALNRTPAV